VLLAEQGSRLLSGDGRAVEASAAGATLLLVSLAVFGSWLPLHTAPYPLSFAVLPVMLWAAYRLEPLRAVSASSPVACVALRATLVGLGPFAGVSRDESIFLMWTFLAVASLTTLVLSVVVSARNRTEQELREAQVTLRAIEAATDAGTWIWRPDGGTPPGSAPEIRLHGPAGWGNPVPPPQLPPPTPPTD